VATPSGNPDTDHTDHTGTSRTTRKACAAALPERVSACDEVPGDRPDRHQAHTAPRPPEPCNRLPNPSALRIATAYNLA
jgi:hypothetical protein